VAASEEPRVFDHDLSAGDEVSARVRGAFQLMRATEAQAAARRGVGRKETRADQAELAKAHAASRDDFASRLQLWVGDPSFAALAEARFGEPVEETIVGLTRRSLAGPVVEDRSLLGADRERGIRVRDVRAGTIRGERTVRLPVFKSVAELGGRSIELGGVLVSTGAIGGAQPPAPAVPPVPAAAPASPDTAKTAVPPEIGEDARALAGIIERRHGQHLSKEQLESIARDFDGDLKAVKRMREVKLGNGEEPDFTFRA
jgi:hypothetical protein